MRATKAYIASLGTTGLLLAFSASLLVLVGTLFAFNAWPGAEIRDAVESVLVQDDEDTVRVAGPEQVALDAAPAAVALRGSSMGGFLAIHAAAGWGRAFALVAICPAPEDMLLRGLRANRFEFEADRETTEPWLEALDLYEAVGRLGPRTALLLMHAEGDEQVPYTVSQELHAAAKEPKRLLLLPGGHHRSLQHDGELQGESLRFIARAASSRG